MLKSQYLTRLWHSLAVVLDKFDSFASIYLHIKWSYIKKKYIIESLQWSKEYPLSTGNTG